VDWFQQNQDTWINFSITKSTYINFNITKNTWIGSVEPKALGLVLNQLTA
jgi:hypothetical protein